MWNNLLSRIRIIDSLQQVCGVTNSLVNLQVLPLAQFRKTEFVGISESFVVKWFNDGKLMSGMNNVFNATVPNGSGKWQVTVELLSSQVRVDTARNLQDQRAFNACK